MASLRRRRLLKPDRLAALDEASLADLVRAAGTYRLKARRLQAFTAWLLDRFEGRWAKVRRASLPEVRQSLLQVAGLGPETADAILLYAAGRPTFVADAYTRRVLARHRLVSRDAAYEVVRSFVERHLPSDPALFNEFHALLVAVGKDYCRTVARCETCPLRFDLRGRKPDI